jgi:hypothetical protein
MHTIFFIAGFARCGITAVNRLLASDERLWCFSEINSLYRCPTWPNTLGLQLEQWCGRKIMGGDFTKEIQQILDLAKLSQKRVIIRDWSFGSFVPLSYNNHTPSMTLNTLDTLEERSNYQVLPVAIVRDPVDVWLSMRDSEKPFHDKSMKGYYAFVSDVINRGIPIVKYEVLAEAENLATLYAVWKIPSLGNSYMSNKATGDLNYQQSSRGVNLQNIERLERRKMSIQEAKWITANTKVNSIRGLLGY